MSVFVSFLSGVLNAAHSTPLTNIVRSYTHRRVIRRFGYKERYHCEGLLPRIKGDEMPLKSIPMEAKPNPWRPAAAQFGRNDYIDILGDGNINPTQLMTSIPQWLRKFKGNEMQMLIRKRVAKNHWKWSRPQKWSELNKRIDYLYKKLNYKTEPKRPEYPSDY